MMYKSFALILVTSVPPPPWYIISFSLLSGAITSGLLPAPAYSPTFTSDDPYAIPPSANLGTAELNTAAIPAPAIPAVMMLIGKGSEALDAIAEAIVSDSFAT